MLFSAQEPTSSPDVDEISDEELVACVLAGDVTSVDVLYNRYSQKIYRFAVHHAGVSHETAEDITQQTFMKALENLATLKKQERFKPWLYRIAHNAILDRQRRNRLRQWVPWQEIKDEQVRDGLCIGTLRQDWEQQVEDEEFVRQILQKVSPRYRQCTYLAVFSAWKTPEIAATLRIPERTVRRYLQKGEAEIRLAYQPLAKEHR